MRTIEITTTQNVVIQVKLATLMDRIIGFIIDLIFLVVVYLILVNLLLTFVGYQSESDQWLYTMLGIVMSFYTLIFHVILRGQTPGKAIIGIKVIKVDGGQPDFVDYFRRWAIRWIDIWASFGAVGLISIETSNTGQRLGDKIADTIVVKKKQSSGYALKDILGITNTETYNPKYPEIQHVNEAAMLTVKRILNRSRKYPSIDKYNDLIVETSQRFEKELGIKRREKSPAAFLKQLLKDYVILTR